ncbi:MAG TPA: hypothetical protein VH723_02355 [Candidatus Limnocylindrales bacterium]|jgi:hypothetical protein
MGGLHLVLAWASVLAALGYVAAAALTATGRTASYRELDGALLVQLGTTALAAVAGLVLPVTGSVVHDPLHVLYAAVAVAVPATARYAGRNDTRRMGRFALIAGLIVLGSLLRLFMTGRA